MDRILIPKSFTRKYLLYHPSDLFMAGYLEDLMKFWQAEPDARVFDLVESCKRFSLKELSMEGMPNECYLGLSFARQIGWNATGELKDSWRFYRDLFLVVENHWADLHWLKNQSLIEDLAWKRPQEMVDHYFWQSLYFAEPGIPSNGDGIDISIQKWYE